MKTHSQFKFREQLEDLLTENRKRDPDIGSYLIVCPEHPCDGFMIGYQPGFLLCMCRTCKAVVLVVRPSSISEGN